MSFACLDQLWKEIEQMELRNLAEPEDEVKPDETVVCVLDDDLKKLYSKQVQLLYRIKDSQRPKWWHLLHPDGLGMPLERALALSKMLSKLFWFEINDRYQLWDKSSVGIRTGWQVVTFDACERMSEDFRKLNDALLEFIKENQ